MVSAEWSSTQLRLQHSMGRLDRWREKKLLKRKCSDLIWWLKKKGCLCCVKGWCGGNDASSGEVERRWWRRDLIFAHFSLKRICFAWNSRLHHCSRWVNRFFFFCMNGTQKSETEGKILHRRIFFIFLNLRFQYFFFFIIIFLARHVRHSDAGGSSGAGARAARVCRTLPEAPGQTCWGKRDKKKRKREKKLVFCWEILQCNRIREERNCFIDSYWFIHPFVAKHLFFQSLLVWFRRLCTTQWWTEKWSESTERCECNKEKNCSFHFFFFFFFSFSLRASCPNHWACRRAIRPPLTLQERRRRGCRSWDWAQTEQAVEKLNIKKQDLFVWFND